MWITNNKGNSVEVVKMSSMINGIIIAWILGILFGAFILSKPPTEYPYEGDPPSQQEMCSSNWGC